MPTLTHIFNDIEYTIEYTYYHGSKSMPGGTLEDPEDYEIIQIWDDDGVLVSEELFDQILSSCDVVKLIREDRGGIVEDRRR